MTDHDSDVMSAAEMLALADHEQRAAAQSFVPDDRLLYSVWGVAWGVGSLARWLTAGDSPRIDASYASGWLLGLLLTTAFVVTVLHIKGRVGGIYGRSARLGRLHGATWAVTFTAYGLISAGLGRADVSYEIATAMASVLPCFIVGILYMSGATLWEDHLQFFLGAWIVLVSGIAMLIGFPDHFLVLAIGGGGGFVVAAGLAARRDWTTR